MIALTTMTYNITN